MRLALALAAPLVPLCVAEGVLRLAGAGYPTKFLVSPAGRPDLLVGNERFAWRFGPRSTASRPDLFAIPASKPEGTVRVVILGESAALGTPDPSFSVARVLEVMLRERYGGVRFEVVNAAMMGITSHAIVPIARDFAEHDADVFIIYMGNNEAIGAWSPVTTAWGLASHLGLVRACLWARGTKGVQAIESAAYALGYDRVAKKQSLETFLESAVRPDDPRLETVARHFGSNLRDICRDARRRGARVVVATVATNLRDCAPLGSLHRADLSAGDLAEWQRRFLEAEMAESAGRIADAVAAYKAALDLDDRYADLHYRLARCLLTLGRLDEARQHYVAARDLDALPFRATGRLNQVVRQTVADLADDGVALVDAERIFETDDSGRPSIPGEELFWEHVHMTFTGNHRLAAALLPAVEAAIPALARRQAEAPVPGAQRCAELLALTASERFRMAAEMERVISRPPFTNQSDHAFRRQRLREIIEDLRRFHTPDAPDRHARIYQAALARAPDDWRLHDNFAVARFEVGDYAAAASHWREVLRFLPHVPAVRLRLGDAAAQQGKVAEALGWYREALRIRPDCAEAHFRAGAMLLAQGDVTPALEHFEAAVRLSPSAAACGQVAAGLASRGRTAEAASWYRRGLALEPDDAGLHDGLGSVLLQQGRVADAADHFRRAIELEPHHVRARLGLARSMLRSRRPCDAVAQYRLALALNPCSADAMAGLAWVLATDPGRRYGGPGEALRLAQRACKETHYKVPLALDSLGAAYAACERFDEAVLAADSAIQLAASAGDESLADEIRRRQQLYRARKPYYEQDESAP